MSVQHIACTVYMAKTKGRRYLTLRAAIHAEASALIANKYPSEQADFDDVGRCTYPGFHWREDENLKRLHARLVRILAKQFKTATALKDHQ
jgi:hypothetical protein